MHQRQQPRLTVADFKPTKRKVDRATWPGGLGRDVHLLYLHCDETQASYFAARRWFASQGQDVDQVAAEQLELEMGYQLCQRMLLASENPKSKLFVDAAQVRRSLTPNEVVHFVEHHNRFAAEEVAGWAGELADPTLRRLAQMLDLPLTATPEQLLEAVDALRGDGD